MRLINKTKHSTPGLRVMLYDLASKANISTRGVTVEVKRANRHLHGICYPWDKRITLWLLNTSKSQDISFIWLHELAHTTPWNRKLYASGHGSKAQKQADSVATRVLDVAAHEVNWHSKDWRTRRFPRYPTRKLALTDLNNRDCFPTLKWRLIRIKSDGKKWWVWQYK